MLTNKPSARESSNNCHWGLKARRTILQSCRAGFQETMHLDKEFKSILQLTPILNYVFGACLFGSLSGCEGAAKKVAIESNI